MLSLKLSFASYIYAAGMTNTSFPFEITETELSSFNIAVAPFVFNEYVYDNLSVGALLIMMFSFIELGKI